MTLIAASLPAFPPAVIVHGLADMRAALAPGRPVTLLSAHGAALYAGCGWWRGLTHLVREECAMQAGHIIDILDCADATGQAFAALRLGQRWLVLAPAAPGFAAAAAVAAAQGGGVLTVPPPALDLAAPGAARALAAWFTAPRRDSHRVLR
ncbi:MAG: hypothetical protein KGL52_08165 [Rhodospirillales bacterium]|jgi:hypothetical protein|nr:hypothetical protein [Rhodospirillales bacterium]